MAWECPECGRTFAGARENVCPGCGASIPDEAMPEPVESEVRVLPRRAHGPFNAGDSPFEFQGRRFVFRFQRAGNGGCGGCTCGCLTLAALAYLVIRGLFSIF